MIKQEISKAPKTLITACYCLDLYMIPDTSVLSRGKHHGVIVKSHGIASISISADKKNLDKLKVIVTDDKIRVAQAVKLSRQQISFGLRRYLLCSCGKQVNSLYLKHNKFACRHCHRLVYEITRLRRGTLAYKLNRNIKIQSASNQVRNIIYGEVGQTKKARRVIAMVGKYC